MRFLHLVLFKNPMESQRTAERDINPAASQDHPQAAPPGRGGGGGSNGRAAKMDVHFAYDALLCLITTATK